MNFVFAREAQEAAKKATTWQKFRMRAFGVKIVVGYETAAGSEEKSFLYLFWCKYCRHYAKDRRHGYRRLYCSYCGQTHRLASVSFKMFFGSIYEAVRIAWKYRNFRRA